MTLKTHLPDLFIQEAGPADAPTLIFLHGGGGAGWMWAAQIEALANDFHCLVPDLPGHGRSDRMAFTIEDAAQQIENLILKRAHHGTAAVVGLSLGAQVLVQLLATAPQVVNRALISSALLHPVGMAWLSSPSMLRWTYRLGVAPFKGSAWYTRLNMRSAAGVPDRYFTQFNEDYQRMTADSFAQITSQNMRFSLPTGVKQAVMPVLVVVGQREYKVMQQSARELVAALPNARGLIVDVGHTMAENHNWNLNAPELFTRLVRAWMTDQALPKELKDL
jgi:pimeloyl-ACP methyl ester carboxylesterase